MTADAFDPSPRFCLVLQLQTIVYLGDQNHLWKSILNHYPTLLEKATFSWLKLLHNYNTVHADLFQFSSFCCLRSSWLKQHVS